MLDYMTLHIDPDAQKSRTYLQNDRMAESLFLSGKTWRPCRSTRQYLSSGGVLPFFIVSFYPRQNTICVEGQWLCHLDELFFISDTHCNMEALAADATCRRFPGHDRPVCKGHIVLALVWIHQSWVLASCRQLVWSVKCYHLGLKTWLISSISGILSQKWYLCILFTQRNHLSLIALF